MEGKLCKKCVLTDKFFSVRMNEDGLCNYCAEQEKKESNIGTDSITKQFSEEKNSNSKYDVLLAYSGGKDSTFTLYLLRKIYHLRVLAVTYDNGFLSDVTYENIRSVTEALDVDSMIVAPSRKKLVQVFKFANEEAKIPPKALERASAICTYCIGLVKSIAYEEAIKRKIPYISFGWTPGQINTGRKVVKMSASMVKQNFKDMRTSILEYFGEEYRSLFLPEELLEEGENSIPSMFYPFANRNYNESEIIELISQFGWVKPKKTDSNSTNCILNTYAIHEHIKKYGFHPYALELAELVRNGQMDREEALKRLNAPLDKEVIEQIAAEFKKYEKHDEERGRDYE